MNTLLTGGANENDTSTGSGLRRALKRKILQARDAGVTHVITSHVLSEVEQLADDVLMLLDRRVHYSGSLRDLRCVTGEQHLEPAIGRLMEASGR